MYYTCTYYILHIIIFILISEDTASERQTLPLLRRILSGTLRRDERETYPVKLGEEPLKERQQRLVVPRDSRGTWEETETNGELLWMSMPPRDSMDFTGGTGIKSSSNIHRW